MEKNVKNIIIKSIKREKNIKYSLLCPAGNPREGQVVTNITRLNKIIDFIIIYYEERKSSSSVDHYNCGCKKITRRKPHSVSNKHLAYKYSWG